MTLALSSEERVSLESVRQRILAKQEVSEDELRSSLSILLRGSQDNRLAEKVGKSARSKPTQLSLEDLLK